MSNGFQPQVKKPSSLPKILTIICSVLAVIFLLMSATMYVSARSKAQEIEDMRAEIQSADAKTVEIDSEITSTKEQIAAAKGKKEAQKWCDDVTRENATETKLRSQGSALKSMNQPTRDAVDNLCSQKKAFIEAFAQDAKANHPLEPRLPERRQDDDDYGHCHNYCSLAPGVWQHGCYLQRVRGRSRDHQIRYSARDSNRHRSFERVGFPVHSHADLGQRDALLDRTGQYLAHRSVSPTSTAISRHESRNPDE